MTLASWAFGCAYRLLCCAPVWHSTGCRLWAATAPDVLCSESALLILSVGLRLKVKRLKALLNTGCEGVYGCEPPCECVT